MAKRPTKSKPKTPKAPQMQLVKALDYIKAVQKNAATDDAKETTCRLGNGYAVAFNGVVAMGYPIEEELMACPHTYKLLAALKRCKAGVSITQLDADRLVIKSGSFRAVIPCLNNSAIPYAVPDPQIALVNDNIKKGFSLLAPVLSKSGITTLESSICLTDNTMLATDRAIIVEYWHGVRLDPERPLTIPVEAVALVGKLSSPLIGIGVGHGTVTFYCEDGAWLRTQLYVEPWPIKTALSKLNENNMHNATALPLDIYEAVSAVAAFSERNSIHIRGNVVSSHKEENIGATHQLQDYVETPVCFNPKYFAYLDGVATRADLSGPQAGYFYGENIRAIVAQMRS